MTRDSDCDCDCATRMQCALVGARPWQWGSYKCECRQGYEYPFNDERTWYFDGPTMQDQYLKMLAGSGTRCVCLCLSYSLLASPFPIYPILVLQFTCTRTSILHTLYSTTFVRVYLLVFEQFIILNVNIFAI